MTPRDREKIAAMLRERLPGRWGIEWWDGFRVLEATCGRPPLVLRIYPERQWTLRRSGASREVLATGSDRPQRRGWRERLVGQIVDAVEVADAR